MQHPNAIVLYPHAREAGDRMDQAKTNEPELMKLFDLARQAALNAA
jgi:hypothetical protein